MLSLTGNEEATRQGQSKRYPILSLSSGKGGRKKKKKQLKNGEKTSQIIMFKWTSV